MKLRVRHVDGGDTHKLALPEVSDVTMLKRRIATAFGMSGAEATNVRVSLNKTIEIAPSSDVASQQSLLRAVGIASGDLVFVMNSLGTNGSGSASETPTASTPEASNACM